MTRRDLLKYLLATPIAATVDLEKLLWVPEKVIFLPTQAQIDFLRNDKFYIDLGGIPYHCSNASTDRWLGFERVTSKEIQIMLEDDNETNRCLES